jgi:hypothetical protein
MGYGMAMTSDEKVENLLFVIWIQDQRHEYWMKFIREIREEIEKDGQEAGEMLLDIEARIGELLPPPEEALKTMKGLAFTSKERGKRLEGITVHRASNARAISRHPDIVEKVKARECKKEVIIKIPS